MVSIPEREPSSFVAGDTVRWLKTVTDYLPEDGWTLQYTFTSKDGTFQVTASDNGDSRYLVELSAAATEGKIAGEYQWHATMTQAPERFTIGTGRTQVLQDIEGSPEAFDTRSYARQLLEAIEATLAGRATTDQASYSIGGVSLARMPMGELLAARDKLRAEVYREDAAERLSKGLGHPSRVFVRL